jgi:hypothetical protein
VISKREFHYVAKINVLYGQDNMPAEPPNITYSCSLHGMVTAGLIWNCQAALSLFQEAFTLLGIQSFSHCGHLMVFAQCFPFLPVCLFTIVPTTGK